MFLISHRQEIRADLKALTKKLKMKQLRMCNKRKECFSSEKGCITPLSLYNNTQGDVTFVVDKALLDMPSLRICAGCDDPRDHSQHRVIDITPAQLLALVKESGGPEPIVLDFDEKQ